MFSTRNVSRAAILALAVSLAAPVGAQEITQSHLDAALDALRASPASRSYDNLLPAVAEQVKSQLILMRPDLHTQISETVDEVVLTLVPRRNDLDNDLARVWAKGFTEDELVTIATFYASPAGQKFNQIGPKVISDAFKVAEGWANRVREELVEKTQEALKNQGVEF
ncbi:MAG: DUF2059 domain-containing protein [Bauldia sp.]|uniref:DUF2059 domain-containing protein n=1 Tax=Bauldia sp. TaxID=2575872 RepID=UPI001DD10C61|nr:DUF2059 domain-containing protein [Bauldia sp.]MCB1487621.1 DUF2059 domain-containing protein [Bauldia sp.]MCB1496363.1 DUF2059 domain-containing protein [Bauldia sp.]